LTRTQLMTSRPQRQKTMSNKSAKEKNKSTIKNAKTESVYNKLATGKVNYRSTTDKMKAKSAMKKVTNLTIHEREKYNVRRVIERGKLR